MVNKEGSEQSLPKGQGSSTSPESEIAKTVETMWERFREKNSYTFGFAKENTWQGFNGVK